MRQTLKERERERERDGSERLLRIVRQTLKERGVLFRFNVRLPGETEVDAK